MRRPSRSWRGLEPLESRQHLAFVFWDGGGGDDNWHNPLNWSGDVLPGAADAAFIDAAGSPTIHIGQDVTVQSIWSLDAIELDAGTVSVAQFWRQAAALTVAGGTIQGAANLEVQADMTWTGGTIAGGTSKIQVFTGRTLTIEGDVALGRQLVNNGTVVWNSGDITATDARIINLPGRTFAIHEGGSLIRSGAQSYFTNYGTLLRDGAAGSTTVISVTFMNATSPANGGSVDVASGTLSFTGTVTSQGEPVWKASSSAAHLVLPLPAYPVGASAVGAFILVGAGSEINLLDHVTSVTSLTLAGGREFTFTALMAASFGLIGSLTIDNPVGMSITIPRVFTTQLQIKSGNVTFPDGFATLVPVMFFPPVATPPSVTVDAGAVLTLGGVTSVPYTNISGAGLIRVAGELQWPSGTMSGPGQLLITPSGRLTSVGQYYELYDRTVTRRIVNYGTIDLTINNGSVFSLSSEIVNRGTLSLGSTFTFGFIQTTAGIGPGNAPGYITNFGAMLVQSPLTLRGAGGGVRLNNQGTVHTSTGATLTLNGGAYGSGTWLADVGSEIVFGGLGSVLSGATMSGDGRFRVACIATWTNTTASGSGDMIVGTAGRLSVLGLVNSLTRSTLTNLGTIGVATGASIIGNFVNNGALSLGFATLTVTGNMTLGTTSAVRVTGPTTGGVPIPARITVSGTSNLAGSLHISYPAPMPQGTFFDLLHTGAYTGTFSGGTTSSGLAPGTLALFALIGHTGTVTVASAI